MEETNARHYFGDPAVLQRSSFNEAQVLDDNVAAIRLLKALEAEGRDADEEEKAVLARYAGWGGVSILFEYKTNNGHRPMSPALSTALFRAYGALAPESVAGYAKGEGLMTAEEWESAKASVNNAHFTAPDVIQSIWKGIEGILPDGPLEILEPAAGVGSFLTFAPRSIVEHARFTCVELDSLSARILRKIHPDATVYAQGFETAPLGRRFDLVVSNVPFGNYNVPDLRYGGGKLSVHDYFFSRGVDLLKPGGVMAAITSRYTMDRKRRGVRGDIARKADLMTAVRMPENSQTAQAGCVVTEDILFLRARSAIRTLEEAYGLPWVSTNDTELPVSEKQLLRLRERGFENPERFHVNRYFVENPDHVLGTMQVGTGQGGILALRVVGEREDLAGRIGERLALLPDRLGELSDADAPAERTEEPEPVIVNAAQVRAHRDIREMVGTVFPRADGTLAIVDGVEMGVAGSRELRIADLPVGKQKIKLYGDYLPVRDAWREVLRQMRETEPNEDGTEHPDMLTAQKDLNRAYDAFVGRHGPLNKHLGALADDIHAAAVSSIERFDPITSRAEKTGIFTERTMSPAGEPERVNDPQDAVALSINRFGRLDLPYIAQKLGTDTWEAKKALTEGESPLAFVDPDSGEMIPAYAYLSGNVRRKLLDLKGREDSRLWQGHIAALDAVQPDPVPLSDIEVIPGADWVPVEVYRQFAMEVLQARWATISQDAQQWSVKLVGVPQAAQMDFGTERRNVANLLERIMNRGDIRVYDKVDDRQVLNGEETMLANEKAAAIQTAWREWLGQDAERVTALEGIYNDRFCGFVPMKVENARIAIQGQSKEISLRDSQRAAITRAILQPTGVFNHEVGTGKTYTQLGAGMKLLELGLIDRAVFAVPKKTIGQFAASAVSLFPNRRIAVMDDSQTKDKNRRRRFLAALSADRYDAVILTYNGFQSINLPLESERDFLIDEQAVIDDMLEMARSSDDKYSVKRLEKARKGLEAKMELLLQQREKGKDEIIGQFDQVLGKRVGLFVDEFHNFKNDSVSVPGNSLTIEGSVRALDMRMKSIYVRNNGGRFYGASGTPVANSLLEFYVLQRYFQPDTLAEMGVDNPLAWFQTFLHQQAEAEPDPAGQGWRVRERPFLVNAAEAVVPLTMVMDTVRADDAGIPRPQATYTTRVIPNSAFFDGVLADAAKRLEKIRAKQVDPSEDNMLLVLHDLNKAGLDPRMVDQNHFVSEDEPCKINEVTRDIAAGLAARDGYGLQLVFCDMGIPKSAAGRKISNDETGDESKISEEEQLGMQGSFCFYDALIDKLVATGIPRERIATVYDAKNDSQLEKLLQRANNGDFSVMIGSTMSMGVGLNMQTHVTDIRFLTVPYRPDQVEQAIGRGLRQGNTNSRINVTFYSQGQPEAYRYRLLDYKSKALRSVLQADRAVRRLDLSTQLNYNETMALTMGDPRLADVFKLEDRLQKLRSLRKSHESRRSRAAESLRWVTETVERDRRRIGMIRELAPAMAAIPRDAKWSGRVLGDKAVGPLSVTGAMEPLLSRLPSDGVHIRFGGIPVRVMSNGFGLKYILENEGSVVYVTENPSAMQAAMLDWDEVEAEVLQRIAANEAEIAQLRVALSKSFEHAREMEDLTREIEALRIATGLEENADEAAQAAAAEHLARIAEEKGILADAQAESEMAALTETVDPETLRAILEKRAPAVAASDEEDAGKERRKGRRMVRAKSPEESLRPRRTPEEAIPAPLRPADPGPTHRQEPSNGVDAKAVSANEGEDGARIAIILGFNVRDMADYREAIEALRDILPEGLPVDMRVLAEGSPISEGDLREALTMVPGIRSVRLAEENLFAMAENRADLARYGDMLMTLGTVQAQVGRKTVPLAKAMLNDPAGAGMPRVPVCAYSAEHVLPLSITDRESLRASWEERAERHIRMGRRSPLEGAASDHPGEGATPHAHTREIAGEAVPPAHPDGGGRPRVEEPSRLDDAPADDSTGTPPSDAPRIEDALLDYITQSYDSVVYLAKQEPSVENLSRYGSWKEAVKSALRELTRADAAFAGYDTSTVDMGYLVHHFYLRHHVAPEIPVAPTATRTPDAPVHPIQDAPVPVLRTIPTVLREFLPRSQYKATEQGLRGEEREYFSDKMRELEQVIANMPQSYQTDGQGDNAPVTLHYFRGNADWYIIEKDSDPDGEGQIQAFGLADLGMGEPELGYINIRELVQAGVEMDYHFAPRTLRELKLEKYPEMVRESAPQPNTAEEMPQAIPSPERDGTESALDALAPWLAPGQMTALRNVLGENPQEDLSHTLGRLEAMATRLRDPSQSGPGNRPIPTPRVAEIQAGAGLVLLTYRSPDGLRRWFITGMDQDSGALYGLQMVRSHHDSRWEAQMGPVSRQDLLDAGFLLDLVSTEPFVVADRMREMAPYIDGVDAMPADAPVMRKIPPLEIPEVLRALACPEQQALWREMGAQADRDLLQARLTRAAQWLESPLSVSEAERQGLDGRAGLALRSGDLRVHWFLTGLNADGRSAFGLRITDEEAALGRVDLRVALDEAPNIVIAHEPGPLRADLRDAAILIESVEYEDDPRAIFWRGGQNGTLPMVQRIEDILDYERNTLENEDVRVNTQAMEYLHLPPVRTLQWVTTTEAAAREYGDPQMVIFTDPVVLARDDHGGVLVAERERLEVAASSIMTPASVASLSDAAVDPIHVQARQAEQQAGNSVPFAPSRAEKAGLSELAQKGPTYQSAVEAIESAGGWDAVADSLALQKSLQDQLDHLIQMRAELVSQVLQEGGWKWTGAAFARNGGNDGVKIFPNGRSSGGNMVHWGYRITRRDGDAPVSLDVDDDMTLKARDLVGSMLAHRKNPQAVMGVGEPDRASPPAAGLSAEIQRNLKALRPFVPAQQFNAICDVLAGESGLESAESEARCLARFEQWISQRGIAYPDGRGGNGGHPLPDDAAIQGVSATCVLAYQNQSGTRKTYLTGMDDLGNLYGVSIRQSRVIAGPIDLAELLDQGETLRLTMAPAPVSELLKEDGYDAQVVISQPPVTSVPEGKSPLLQQVEQLAADIRRKEAAQAASPSPTLGEIMAHRLSDLVAAKRLEEIFGSDDALGVRFVDHQGNEIPMTMDADGQSVFPDGTSATICTNYAEQIKTHLPGYEVQIVGFENEKNPDCAVAREEWHPGGHDFAIVDHRWLVDPWARLVASVRDQIVYDLRDPDDAQKVADTYGDPLKWVLSGTSSIGHESALDLWDRTGLEGVIEAIEAGERKAAGITIAEAAIIPTRAGVIAVPTDPNLPIYHAGLSDPVIPSTKNTAEQWLSGIPEDYRESVRSVLVPFTVLPAKVKDATLTAARTGHRMLNAELEGPEWWRNGQILLHAKIEDATREVVEREWSLSWSRESVNNGRLYAMFTQILDHNLLDSLHSVDRVQADYGHVIVNGILGRNGIAEIMACRGLQPLRLLLTVEPDGMPGETLDRLTGYLADRLRGWRTDFPETPVVIDVLTVQGFPEPIMDQLRAVAESVRRVDTTDPEAAVRRADLTAQIGAPCDWVAAILGHNFRSQQKRDLVKPLLVYQPDLIEIRLEKLLPDVFATLYQRNEANRRQMDLQGFTSLSRTLDAIAMQAPDVHAQPQKVEASAQPDNQPRIQASLLDVAPAESTVTKPVSNAELPSATTFGTTDPIAQAMLTKIGASPYTLPYLLGDERARDVDDPPYAEDAEWLAARVRFADEIDAVLNARIRQNVDALGERGWMQPILHGDLTRGGAMIHLDAMLNADGDMQGLSYRVSLAADTEGREIRTVRDYLRGSSTQFANELHGIAEQIKQKFNQREQNGSQKTLDNYVVAHIREHAPIVAQQAKANALEHFLLGNVMSAVSNAILDAIEDKSLPQSMRDAAKAVLQGREDMDDYRARIGRLIFDAEMSGPAAGEAPPADSQSASIESVEDRAQPVRITLDNGAKPGWTDMPALDLHGLHEGYRLRSESLGMQTQMTVMRQTARGLMPVIRIMMNDPHHLTYLGDFEVEGDKRLLMAMLTLFTADPDAALRAAGVELRSVRLPDAHTMAYYLEAWYTARQRSGHVEAALENYHRANASATAPAPAEKAAAEESVPAESGDTQYPVIVLENVGDAVAGAMTGFSRSGKQLWLSREDGSVLAVEHADIDDWRLVGMFNRKGLDARDGDEARAIQAMLEARAEISLKIEVNEGLAKGPVPILTVQDGDGHLNRFFIDRLHEIHEDWKAANVAFAGLTEHYAGNGLVTLGRNERQPTVSADNAELRVRYDQPDDPATFVSVSMKFAGRKDAMTVSLMNNTGDSSDLWGDRKSIENRNDLPGLIAQAEGLRDEALRQRDVLWELEPFIQAYLNSYAQAARHIRATMDNVDKSLVTNESSARDVYRAVGEAVREGQDIIETAADDLRNVSENGQISMRVNDRLGHYAPARQHREVLMAVRALETELMQIAKDRLMQRGRDFLASADESTPIEDVAVAIFNKHGIEAPETPSMVNYVRDRDLQRVQGAIGHNSMNPASQEIFERMTGIRLEKTQKARVRQIDAWANVTPEMRERMDAEGKSQREERQNQKELRSAWESFAGMRMQRGGTGQDYVLAMIGEGHTQVSSYKKGVSVQYGLLNPETHEVRYMTRSPQFTRFCKAVLKMSVDGVVLDALRKADLVDGPQPLVSESASEQDPEIERLFGGEGAAAETDDGAAVQDANDGGTSSAPIPENLSSWNAGDRVIWRKPGSYGQTPVPGVVIGAEEGGVVISVASPGEPGELLVKVLADPAKLLPRNTPAPLVDEAREASAMPAAESRAKETDVEYVELFDDEPAGLIDSDEASSGAGNFEETGGVCPWDPDEENDEHDALLRKLADGFDRRAVPESLPMRSPDMFSALGEIRLERSYANPHGVLPAQVTIQWNEGKSMLARASVNVARDMLGVYRGVWEIPGMATPIHSISGGFPDFATAYTRLRDDLVANLLSMARKDSETKTAALAMKLARRVAENPEGDGMEREPAQNVPAYTANIMALLRAVPSIPDGSEIRLTWESRHGDPDMPCLAIHRPEGAGWHATLLRDDLGRVNDGGEVLAQMEIGDDIAAAMEDPVRALWTGTPLRAALPDEQWARIANNPLGSANDPELHLVSPVPLPAMAPAALPLWPRDEAGAEAFPVDERTDSVGNFSSYAALAFRFDGDHEVALKIARDAGGFVPRAAMVNGHYLVSGDPNRKDEGREADFAGAVRNAAKAALGMVRRDVSFTDSVEMRAIERSLADWMQGKKPASEPLVRIVTPDMPERGRLDEAGRVIVRLREGHSMRDGDDGFSTSVYAVVDGEDVFLGGHGDLRDALSCGNAVLERRFAPDPMPWRAYMAGGFSLSGGPADGAQKAVPEVLEAPEGIPQSVWDFSVPAAAREALREDLDRVRKAFPDLAYKTQNTVSRPGSDRHFTVDLANDRMETIRLHYILRPEDRGDDERLVSGKIALIDVVAYGLDHRLYEWLARLDAVGFADRIEYADVVNQPRNAEDAHVTLSAMLHRLELQDVRRRRGLRPMEVLMTVTLSARDVPNYWESLQQRLEMAVAQMRSWKAAFPENPLRVHAYLLHGDGQEPLDEIHRRHAETQKMLATAADVVIPVSTAKDRVEARLGHCDAVMVVGLPPRGEDPQGKELIKWIDRSFRAEDKKQFNRPTFVYQPAFSEIHQTHLLEGMNRRFREKARANEARQESLDALDKTLAILAQPGNTLAGEGKPAAPTPDPSAGETTAAGMERTPAQEIVLELVGTVEDIEVVEVDGYVRENGLWRPVRAYDQSEIRANLADGVEMERVERWGIRVIREDGGESLVTTAASKEAATRSASRIASIARELANRRIVIRDAYAARHEAKDSERLAPIRRDEIARVEDIRQEPEPRRGAAAIEPDDWTSREQRWVEEIGKGAPVLGAPLIVLDGVAPGQAVFPADGYAASDARDAGLGLILEGAGQDGTLRLIDVLPNTQASVDHVTAWFGGYTVVNRYAERVARGAAAKDGGAINENPMPGTHTEVESAEKALEAGAPVHAMVDAPHTEEIQGEEMAAMEENQDAGAALTDEAIFAIEDRLHAMNLEEWLSERTAPDDARDAGICCDAALSALWRDYPDIARHTRRAEFSTDDNPVRSPTISEKHGHILLLIAERWTLDPWVFHNLPGKPFRFDYWDEGESRKAVVLYGDPALWEIRESGATAERGEPAQKIGTDIPPEAEKIQDVVQSVAMYEVQEGKPMPERLRREVEGLMGSLLNIALERELLEMEETQLKERITAMQDGYLPVSLALDGVDLVRAKFQASAVRGMEEGEWRVEMPRDAQAAIARNALLLRKADELSARIPLGAEAARRELNCVEKKQNPRARNRP